MDETDKLDAEQSLWDTLDLESMEAELPEAEAFGETMRLPPKTASERETLDEGELSQTGIRSIQLNVLPRVSFVERDESAPSDLHDRSGRKDLEIKGLLGEGGMGQVHLARQHSLGRDVAIKRIKHAQESPRSVKLLLHEGYITGQLEHPNIIPVYALGRDASDAPLIVMKRVEGVAWEALIQDPSHPAWSQVKGWSDDPLEQHIEILMEVCSAITYAHSKGYLHLDIKPDNVMLGAFGEIYLLDWGIAHSSEKEEAGEQLFSMAGTPFYMAPEMLDPMATPPDERTDVYLLGATLHEVLVGETKHLGDTLAALLYSVACSTPFEYPAHVPKEIAAICNKATHANPNKRFSTVKEFRGALVHFLRHRDSVLLSDKATVTLERIFPRIAAASAARVHDVGAAPGGQAEGGVEQDASLDVHHLFQECMFGFSLALEKWSENQSAIDGTQRLLEAMIRFELSSQHVLLARSLYQSLPAPNEALEQEMKAVELAQQTQKEERAALQQMAKEHDPTTSKGVRLWILGGLTTLVLLMVSSVFLRGIFNQQLVVRNIMLPTTLLLFIVGGVILVFRKRIFVNAYSKSFSMMLVYFAVYLWIHRALAFHRVTVGFSSVLMDDLLLISAIVAMGGVTVQAWLLPIAVLQIFFAVLMFFFPVYALPLMLGGGFISMGSILFFVWRGKG